MSEKVLSEETDNIILSDGKNYSDRRCLISTKEIPENMHAIKIIPESDTAKYHHTWISLEKANALADEIENITRGMYDRPREDRSLSGDFVFMEDASHELPCIICGDIITEFLIGIQFSSIWFHHDCRHDFSDALRKIHDYSDWIAAERL